MAWCKVLWTCVLALSYNFFKLLCVSMKASSSKASEKEIFKFVHELVSECQNINCHMVCLEQGAVAWRVYISNVIGIWLLLLMSCDADLRNICTAHLMYLKKHKTCNWVCFYFQSCELCNQLSLSDHPMLLCPSATDTFTDTAKSYFPSTSVTLNRTFPCLNNQITWYLLKVVMFISTLFMRYHSPRTPCVPTEVNAAHSIETLF